MKGGETETTRDREQNEQSVEKVFGMNLDKNPTNGKTWINILSQSWKDRNKG